MKPGRGGSPYAAEHYNGSVSSDAAAEILIRRGAVRFPQTLSAGFWGVNSEPGLVCL